MKYQGWQQVAAKLSSSSLRKKYIKLNNCTFQYCDVRKYRAEKREKKEERNKWMVLMMLKLSVASLKLTTLSGSD